LTPGSQVGSIAAVELVLGHQKLAAAGGTETYLLTVAEQLQRLGHDVTIFALEAGEMAHVAATRGLRVVTAEHELPATCDGLLAQDAVVSLILAERYPGTVQVFVAHAPGVDFQRPVQLDGVISAVVVLNDRVAGRLDGLALQHEVVRLRQPIDVQRFTPRGGPSAAPAHVVLVSNYVQGREREMLARTCARAGLKLKHLGLHGRPTTTPELDIAACDITVGHGRAALEGMASGRAVYILHRASGDGWVTPSSYPAFEADGFAGAASDDTIDGARLQRDLAGYRPEMGVVNRQLAFSHHHALDHARDLVVLLRRLSPSTRPPSRAPLREMARLVRMQWQTEGRYAALAIENESLREQLEQERARAHSEALAIHAELDAFRRTRRYRLASLLARPVEALRRLRR
jgi:hypothetical protein